MNALCRRRPLTLGHVFGCTRRVPCDSSCLAPPACDRSIIPMGWLCGGFRMATPTEFVHDRGTLFERLGPKAESDLLADQRLSMRHARNEHDELVRGRGMLAAASPATT